MCVLSWGNVVVLVVVVVKCVCVSLKAMSIVVWSAMGIWENMWNGLTGSYRFWVYLLPEWQESQL